jgi:SAM-dependent methyltransferase
VTDPELFDAFERTGWRGRASAYERGFARVTVHAVGPLLDAAGVAGGSAVLDVGCGPGPVTGLALARGARVTAVDADQEMFETTARRFPEATVLAARLPALPFGDDEFDAVVGNFVINHTGDPPVALRELVRVLRPGGRLALTCWTYPSMRAMDVFREAVEAAGAPHPRSVPATAPFSAFAERGPFAGLFTSAGCTEVMVDALRWTHRVDPERWWRDVLAGTCVNAAVIASQPPDLLARVKAEYDRLVAPYAVPGGDVELPVVALLAAGRKPGHQRSGPN